MSVIQSFSNNKTVGKRYILEELLGQGGMGAVYRAHDRLSRQPVALKVVTLQAENLQFATKATGMDTEIALAHEFKTLASLRHPNIISVLDYGFDEHRRPFFTMELLENAETIIDAGRHFDEDGQVQLLIQVLQALAYLHRRGIVHRDLKPDNVVVIDGHVKVLDFGLAIAQDYLAASQDVVVGTLAYIAPEVLQSEPATFASDMYAVGIMAYELFAERHPYTLTDVSQLIEDIISTHPPIEPLGLGPVLSSVLERLLAKDPADRINDPRELIKLYADSTDQQIRYETDVIRESYLQAARFVGRQSEMAILTDALQQSLTGPGGTWLISGESGVGKSRLLDELRIQALVQGALAVLGGAVSDGSQPYQVWHEPLRRLVLEVEVSEQEAGILKAIVPDIEYLMDCTAATAPDLDPQATQNRLLETVETVFRRQAQPAVVFLEDLHWAGSESIALLNRLSRLEDLPLLIIGSVRTDATAHWQQLAINAHYLELDRLDPEGIQQISTSMLGETGRRPEVVDLLQRETEGNVFFIVEVVRALAEEAGELDLVGAVSLPESVFAGGIQRIVERRLQGMPEDALRYLHYAAVIGREIDLLLLKHLDTQFDPGSWLALCDNAAVLEVREARWRFVHDKLRELLLNQLPDRARYHQEVAQAIEVVYATNLAAHYANLAYHWQQAQVTDKAILYLEKAGEQALRNYANEEAIQFFSQAITLADQAQTNMPAHRRAGWHRQIGHAYWGLGNLAALREHVEHALKLHQRPIPPDQSGLGLGLGRQTAIQAAHLVKLPAPSSSSKEMTLEIVRAYKLLGQAYFFLNESNLTVYVTLQQVNLAEGIQASPELAEGYANMCLVAGLIPLHRLARTYERRSIKIAEVLDDTYTIAQVTSVISLYYLGLGHWQRVQELVQRSASLAEEIGDRRMWESVSGVGALAHAYQGRLTQAREVFEAVYRSARKSGNTQTHLWGMLGQAENLLPAGELDQAQAYLEEAQALPIQKFGRDSVIRTHALAAQLYFQQGKHEQARQTALLALKEITQAPPTASFLLQHYGMVAEILLTHWENDRASANAALARQIVSAMRKFSQVFPIGRPRAALCQGWAMAIENRQEQAIRIWQRGLQDAGRLVLPYEQARLHALLGRYTRNTTHSAQAAAIFERLGAHHDVAQTRQHLT
jgi:eukaryotic-like serine/threonine-protein kinase